MLSKGPSNSVRDDNAERSWFLICSQWLLRLPLIEDTAVKMSSNFLILLSYERVLTARGGRRSCFDRESLHQGQGMQSTNRTNNGQEVSVQTQEVLIELM